MEKLKTFIGTFAEILSPRSKQRILTSLKMKEEKEEMPITAQDFGWDRRDLASEIAFLFAQNHDCTTNVELQQTL